MLKLVTVRHGINIALLLQDTDDLNANQLVLSLYRTHRRYLLELNP